MKPTRQFSNILFRVALVAALLLTFSVSLVPPQSVRADEVAGTGPGGVGNRLGTSALELWLRADAPGFQATNCTSLVTTDDQRVGCWVDQSGSGNNLTAPGNDNRPTYENDAGNALNGKPVVQFGNVGGINRYLERTVSVNNQTFTLIAVSVPGVTTAEGASVFASAPAAINGTFQLDAGGGANCPGEYRLHHTLGGSNYTCGGTLGTTARIFGVQVIDNTRKITWNNGEEIVNSTSATFRPDFSRLRVGMGRVLGQTWPNDIAEVILYYSALNTAQRRLVENYLQAKYNDSTTNPLSLGIYDRYDGDTSANGNFDLDVAGIGQEIDGSHPHAHSAGMIVENSTFLSNNGDYILFGHKVPTNVVSPLDLPTGWDANAARWLRHWYIQVTDVNGNGGVVNLQFDFDEADVPAGINPGGDVNNYRLLRRSDQTGQFSDIATATSINAADRMVTFSGVDVTLLGSNFTLATLDNTTSPIGGAPTAVTILDMAAVALPGGAQVTWTTALEEDTVLFNLYRAEAPDGERALVEQVLPQGQPGASYTVEDLGLTPFMTYYYWLEVVSVEGSETFELSPVTAWGSYFLPLMVRSP